VDGHQKKTVFRTGRQEKQETQFDAEEDFAEYFFLYRSTRPAVSTSFWRPVKKGWQLEQISSFRSPIVERVSNVFPQMQVTVAFLYSGWMPAFIVKRVLSV
jgi:hypothetical protein